MGVTVLTSLNIIDVICYNHTYWIIVFVTSVTFFYLRVWIKLFDSTLKLTKNTSLFFFIFFSSLRTALTCHVAVVWSITIKSLSTYQYILLKLLPHFVTYITYLQNTLYTSNGCLDEYFLHWRLSHLKLNFLIRK